MIGLITVALEAQVAGLIALRRVIQPFSGTTVFLQGNAFWSVTADLIIVATYG